MRMNNDNNGGLPRTKTVDAYCRAKINMLKRDFYINPTPEEIAHFKELKSEIQIDQFSLTVICRHLG